MMSWRLPFAVAGAVAVLAIILFGCQPTGTQTAQVPPQQKPQQTMEEEHLYGKKNAAGTEKPAEAPKPSAHQLAEDVKPPSLEEAKDMTKSEDTQVQMKGVQALAEAIPLLDPSDAKPALAELIEVALNRSNTTEVRSGAAEGLVHVINDYEEARQALEKLAKDPDPDVREHLAAALEHARHTPAVKHMVELMAQDPDPSVRATAIHVRSVMEAESKNRADLEALADNLGVPEGDASAQAAIQFVVKGGGKPDPVLDVLMPRATGSPNPRQRHAAAMCVGLICAGTNPQQEKFGRLARATKKQEIRLHKAITRGVEPLIKDLKDPDPYVRETAAQGLGYIGDPRAAKPLGEALSDPSPYVRRRAAAALITVPAKDAEPYLENTVRSDPDPIVRRYAVEALGWIDDDSVVPTLIIATRDANARVRRFAAQELGRRKAREALPALVPLFNDPDEDVRWQAVLAVGKMRDKQAVDALVKALDDPAPQVSNAAERALQRLGIARRKERYLK